MPDVIEDISIGEMKAAIKCLKRGKAAGSDGIVPEFLHNLGPRDIGWLTIIMNIIALYHYSVSLSNYENEYFYNE